MNTKDNIKLFKSKTGKRVACLKFAEDILLWGIEYKNEQVTVGHVKNVIQGMAEKNLGHKIKPDVMEAILIILSISQGNFGEIFVFTFAASVMNLIEEG